MKKIIGILFVLVILTCGVLYWYTQIRLPPVIGEITISPKWVNQAQFAGIFVAIDKGIYRKHGLIVHVKEFNDSSSVLDDVTSGTSQFGLMSANEVLTSVARGAPIKGIAAFYQVSPYVVVSLKQLNLTSPVELKGKRLGIKGGPGAEGESIYAVLFKAAGFDTSDFSFSYIPFGTSEFQDLLAEKADVIGLYRTDQLYEFDKNNIGYSALYPERYGSATYNDVLVARSDYLAANDAVVRTFIDATKDGWKYAFKHENETLDIVSTYVTHDTYADREHERFILEQSKPLIAPSNAEIGAMTMERWTTYADLLKGLGVLPASFDVTTAVTTAYLK